MGFLIFSNASSFEFCYFLKIYYIINKKLQKDYDKKKEKLEHYEKKIPYLEEKIFSQKQNIKMQDQLERVLILFIKK